MTGEQNASFYDRRVARGRVRARPAVAALRDYLKDTSLLHLEMMQALAGKRDELIKEREMENAFNRARRGDTLIFTHEQARRGT